MCTHMRIDTQVDTHTDISMVILHRHVCRKLEPASTPTRQPVSEVYTPEELSTDQLRRTVSDTTRWRAAVKEDGTTGLDGISVIILVSV